MSQPESPRAVVYARNGGPEVLALVEKPVLAPGAGEVRVRIHRSGVNPTDWKSRVGAGDGAAVDPPQVPNQDGAGVIDAVGPGVDPVRVGQRVWVWEAAYQRADGTAQDYALIPHHQAVPLPDAASFDLGAGLPIPFITAHRCLTVTEGGPEHLAPGALTGRVVFVAGGAGAVGNAAIQLARWADATVVTTVSSPEKARFAAAAGADHIINYRETDVADEVRRIFPGGVHTIVEVSPARNSDMDARILAPNGSIAIYANDGGDDMSLPIRTSMAPNIRWQFVLVYTAPRQAKEHAVRSVSAALAAGAIREVLPFHHFPLDQAAAAHEAVQNSTVGKVLIDLV